MLEMPKPFKEKVISRLPGLIAYRRSKPFFAAAGKVRPRRSNAKVLPASSNSSTTLGG